MVQNTRLLFRESVSSSGLPGEQHPQGENHWISAVLFSLNILLPSLAVNSRSFCGFGRETPHICRRTPDFDNTLFVLHVRAESHHCYLHGPLDRCSLRSLRATSATFLGTLPTKLFEANFRRRFFYFGLGFFLYAALDMGISLMMLANFCSSSV